MSPEAKLKPTPAKGQSGDQRQPEHPSKPEVTLTTQPSAASTDNLLHSVTSALSQVVDNLFAVIY